MTNIIKEMLRQTIRDKVLWFFSVYFIVAGVIIFTQEEALRETGSSAFCYVGQILPMLLAMTAGILTSRVCGSDLGDKTANYEILFGKHRREVYFGRFIAAMTAVTVVTVVFLLVMVGIPTLFNDWGASLAPGDTAVLMAMILPFAFRMVCFFTALTFAVRNDIIPFVITFVGTLVLMVSTMLLQDSGITITWHSALTDFSALFDFSNMTQGFADGKDITAYKVEPGAGTVLRMLATSLGIGAAWLFGGFALFRRSDIS